jgi:hypothetical protein
MKDILAELGPMLRSCGLKGSGQNFRKITELCVSVVNFQKSSSGDRFYVNLGVQPLFIPDVGGQDPDPQKIKEYECVFRRRLPPPQGLLGWPYAMNSLRIEALKSELDAAIEQYIEPLMLIPGPLTELTPEEFMIRTEDPLFGRLDAANCLVFARIAMARKENDKAHAFTKHGLEICPPAASSLRGHLKEIVQKTKPDAPPNAGSNSDQPASVS